ncbi:MAG TPA: hypothetical protein VFZ69_12765 [Longimicrobiales bacterium]
MPTFDIAIALVVLLGAVHGLNPAMGWLFAVSLGFQEGSSRAVWRALPPLALGHALAVAAALVAATVLGLALPLAWLRWITAAALLGFGAFHLLRHRHPRYGGMRVGRTDLTIWSFLMASAHGAGLMVLPLLLNAQPQAAHAGHHAALSAGVAAGLLAALLHTAGYLGVAGALAYVVHAKLGLRMLRTAWFNINLVWAAALIVTAVMTPLL